MLTFLFWNLKGNPLDGIIGDLARVHRVDVLMFAECLIRPATMLTTLNRDTTEWFLPYSLCRKIAVYTRFPASFLTAIDEDDRTSIRRLTLPGLDEILLVVTHLPSKLWKEDESQDFDMPVIANRIRYNENTVKHQRTILVGDMNMDPFQHGIVAGTGLHAVSARTVAEDGERLINNTTYPYFYNPMWGHFGHTTDGPPGTFYRSGSTVSYFWHIFDQVLIRPALLPYFDDRELKILSGIGKISFISTKKGLPKADEISDHLPILFRLNI